MSDKQNSLIQFETGDLPNSHARHYKKAKTHSYLFPFFPFSLSVSSFSSFLPILPM